MALNPSMLLSTVLSVLMLVGTGKPDLQELHTGTTLRDSIVTGITRTYILRLQAGEIAELTLDQGGTDLAVTVTPPAGHATLVDVRESGPDSILVDAQTSGVYRLELRTVEEQRSRAVYRVTLERIRPREPTDDRRLEAQQAATEAKQAEHVPKDLRQGISKCSQALEDWRELGDRQGEAAALAERATLHMLLLEFDLAKQDLLEGLEIARNVPAPWTVAEALTNLGFTLGSLGEPAAGAEHLEEAVALWRKLGGVYEQAGALHNLARVYTDLAQYEKALKCHQQILPLLTSMGETAHAAYTYSDEALIFQRLAEDQAAIQSYNRAIALFHRVDQPLQEGRERMSLGNFLANTSPAKAAAQMESALQLFTRANSYLDIANAWRGLGTLRMSAGDNNQAQRDFENALANYRQGSSQAGEANAFVSIGNLLTQEGDFNRALSYFNQALALFRSLHRSFAEAGVLRSIGEMYTRAKNYELAIQYFGQALPIYHSLSQKRLEAATLFQVASAERAAGQLNDAQAHAAALIDLTESVRALIAGPQLRASYLAANRQYYEFTWDLYLQMDREYPGQGFVARALEMAERGRARSLLDMLDETRTGRNVNPEMAQHERTMHAELNFWSERLDRAAEGNDSAKQKSIADKLESLLGRYHELESEVRAADPQYAVLAPLPLKLVEIQSAVLDANTVLLEYAIGAEQGHLWAVTPSSVAVFDLPKGDVIKRSVQQFYRAMHAASQTPDDEKAGREARSASAALGRTLLAPAADLIRGKRLLIVADGALEQLPFAALTDPQTGLSLIAGHEVVFVPSASVLAEERKEVAGAQRAPNGLAVIADPVFDPGDARVDAPANRTLAQRFARLPFTRKEAESILRLAPQEKSIEALGFDARRDLLTSGKLAQFSLIHIATHAVTDVARPELSSLVFSMVDAKGAPQQGYLHLHEIASLRLPAKLVTLSACGTGLGKQLGHEGTIGLARGFLYAGASTVVVSLWDVEDESTAELMRLFYRAMLGPRHLPPVAALRQAQIAMSRNKRWTAYNWSGWAAIGEWR